MSHLPIDDEPEFIGVAVTGCAAQPDGPRPRVIDPGDASHALEKMTCQITSILAASGVHPLVVETAGHQITQMWSYALRTVNNDH